MHPSQVNLHCMEEIKKRKRDVALWLKKGWHYTKACFKLDVCDLVGE